MIKAVLFFVTAIFFSLGISCSPNSSVPGDTAVETRTIEAEKEPGNILAEGRVEAGGR